MTLGMAGQVRTEMLLISLFTIKIGHGYKQIAKMTTTEPNNNFIYKFYLCKFNIFRDINIQYTYKIYTAA